MCANRIVLAVDAASRRLTGDDLHLRDAFERRGIAVDVRLWGDRLDNTSTVVIRSTWDYVERPTSADDLSAPLDRRGRERHRSA